MGGPLEGLKVLDIATIIAAPLAATLLADYGADVLKIEMPGQGDGVRSFPPFKDGKPLWWKTANRNKKFATLDLRTPEGLALFKQMLPRFDVLIENFRPGSLADLGAYLTGSAGGVQTFQYAFLPGTVYRIPAIELHVAAAFTNETRKKLVEVLKTFGKQFVSSKE